MHLFKIIESPRNHFILQPDWLDRLTNLTNIYLQANYLTELPDAISSLINLETLDVSHNLLTSIPSSIGRLRKLKKIILTQNKLTELPDAVGELQCLVSLQLNNNSLSSLPHSLTKCRSLEELHLDLNQFKQLPNFLTRLPNLRSLSACRNQLNFLPCLPFADIHRFLFDSNCQVSHLPYILACQLSKVPVNPLVTRGVLYISCFHCFNSLPRPECLNVKTAEGGADEHKDACLHLPPALNLVESAVPSLVEISLRSILQQQFGPIAQMDCDNLQCLHRFKVNEKFVERYDQWISGLATCLPLSLVDVLKDGPSAFCSNPSCSLAIFRNAYPIFVTKIIVQTHGATNILLQRVVCCMLFCCRSCYTTYDVRCQQSWEKEMLQTQLQWSQL